MIPEPLYTVQHLQNENTQIKRERDEARKMVTELKKERDRLCEEVKQGLKKRESNES